MQDSKQTGKERLTISTISSMIRVLNDALKTDPSLGNDLLLFLKEKNIHVPTLSQQELSELIPVSYKKKNSKEQLQKLQNAFEKVDDIEHIL